MTGTSLELCLTVGVKGGEKANVRPSSFGNKTADSLCLLRVLIKTHHDDDSDDDEDGDDIDGYRRCRAEEVGVLCLV